MVDRITQLYGVNKTPIAKKPNSVERSEKRRESSVAARLLPDLEDKVEFSEEGLRAARSFTSEGEMSVPSETRQTIENNWYADGIRMAYESLD